MDKGGLEPELLLRKAQRELPSLELSPKGSAGASGDKVRVQQDQKRKPTKYEVRGALKLRYKFEHKYEPRYHEEAGHWYAEMIVHMCEPEIDEDEFETEEECQIRCNELNLSRRSK